VATAVLSNVIKDPSGTAVADVVVNIRLWPGIGFRESDNSEIAQLVSVISNGSGAWSAPLEKTDDIFPEGSYWQVEEQIPEDRGGPKQWLCALTANSTVAAARVNPVLATGLTTFLTQVQGDARYIQQIVGTALAGRGAFAVRPASGTAGQIYVAEDINRWYEWSSTSGRWIAPDEALGFNPQDYGALGNGVADDGPAITSTSLAAGTGGIVRFPELVFRIVTPVVISALGNQHWIGTRSNTTTSGSIIRCSTNGIAAVTQLDGGFTFSNLNWDLTGTSTSKALVLGNSSTLASGGKILNCGFFACYHAISLRHCSDVLIQGGNFEANVIAIAAVDTGTYIPDDLAGGTIQADQIQILGNAFYRNSQSIEFDYGVDGQINDNFFLQDDGPAYGGGAPSIFLNTANCNRFTVANNNGDTLGGLFVNIEISSYHAITGNVIRNCKRGGIRDNGGNSVISHNVLLTGSAIAANTHDGILLSGNRSVAIGNYVSSGWRYCMHVTGGNNTYGMNVLINAATASINDVGSGSKRLLNDIAEGVSRIIGEKLIVTSGIGVGAGVLTAATTPGSVVKKMQIFDDTGASAGFIPVYNAIT
jgi:hypothetical protein